MAPLVFPLLTYRGERRVSGLVFDGLTDALGGRHSRSTPCALCASSARVTRLSATLRETARPGGGRVCRLRCVACALLRSAGLLVFRRMSAPARDAFLIYPSGGLGRRCWFVRSLSFRFRFCRQITGAGPCGLFILLGWCDLGRRAGCLSGSTIQGHLTG